MESKLDKEGIEDEKTVTVEDGGDKTVKWDKVSGLGVFTVSKNWWSMSVSGNTMGVKGTRQEAKIWDLMLVDVLVMAVKRKKFHNNWESW